MGCYQGGSTACSRGCYSRHSDPKSPAWTDGWAMVPAIGPDRPDPADDVVQWRVYGDDPGHRRRRLHRQSHLRRVVGGGLRRRRRRRPVQRLAEGGRCRRRHLRTHGATSSSSTSPTARVSKRSSPRNRIDGVIHFAGLKAVGESVAEPLRYFRVNLGTTITLAETMAAADVRRLVFSSSATVYSPTAPMPLHEDAAHRADQPLRRHQGDDRADPARRCSRRPDDWPSGCCATSTRSAPTRAVGSARTRQGCPTT